MLVIVIITHLIMYSSHYFIRKPANNHKIYVPLILSWPEYSVGPDYLMLSLDWLIVIYTSFNNTSNTNTKFDNIKISRI